MKNRLVEEGFVTQEVADKYETQMNIFLDNIAPTLAKENFYPEPKNIFRALNECPTPKVVILGQDCYFKEGQANGLAFDVNDNVPIPPSLRNIQKELANDLGEIESWEGDENSIMSDSYLGYLPQQGVLLINTALTVRPNEAGSHTKLWQPFTNSLIEELQKQDNIVWILWGNHAKSYQSLITNKSHLILTGTHPMPLAANRGGFFGGKYFSEANAYLRTTNQTPINW